MIVCLLVLACALLDPEPTGTPILGVEEVYDVPPPPGFRTLALRGLVLPPGAIVGIHGPAGRLGTAEVVVDGPDGVIAYVPERIADEVLDGHALSGVSSIGH